MGLLDVLLPVDCAGCGRPGSLCCPGCALRLTGPARLCWPTPRPPDLPVPHAVAAYDGSVRALLLAYKERGAVGLRQPLGDALAIAVSAGLSRRQPVVLVPIPSSAEAMRTRGDDVVLGVARRCARRLGALGYDLRVIPLLRHGRRVQDSAGLTAADRAANLRGAFAVRGHALPSVRTRPVVLVDDLMTTGATFAEAARTLRTAGVAVCRAAAIAATTRRLLET